MDTTVTEHDEAAQQRGMVDTKYDENGAASPTEDETSPDNGQQNVENDKRIKVNEVNDNQNESDSNNEVQKDDGSSRSQEMTGNSVEGQENIIIIPDQSLHNANENESPELGERTPSVESDSAEELVRLARNASTDSIGLQNADSGKTKDGIVVSFGGTSPTGDKSPVEVKIPSPPSSAVSTMTRKKSGSILKKSSASSEKLYSPAKSADFYVDASGNMRQISPNDVNTNQFFPDLSNLDRSSAVTREDSDEFFGTQVTRQPSATKTVHFDENGPQITELEDDDQYELAEYEEEEDMDSVMRGERPYSAETSDSISLPAASPGFFRETQSDEIFANTQVDEETLEAAKIRQKRRTYILDGDGLEPVIPVKQTLAEIVEKKAKIQ